MCIRDSGYVIQSSYTFMDASNRIVCPTSNNHVLMLRATDEKDVYKRQVLVRGAGVLAGAGCGGLCGGQLRQGKGTLTETSIPIESWQLAELTWGEPGENSAPQGLSLIHI